MELRPTKFDDIIGQEHIKEVLEILVGASEKRKEALPHVLFEGPPGLGKTTLARALANEAGRRIVIGNGANIGSMKKMLPYVMDIQGGDILFIDEIHRLPIPIQEFLLTVIEDFRVDLSDGVDTTSIELPKFSFVGATTEGGTLLAPLRDRFKQKLQLELYSNVHLYEIGKGNAKRLNLNLDEEGLLHLARVSRGTPRVLNSGLEWMRDYCTSKNISQAGKETVVKALAMTGVDEHGRTKQDRLYLKALAGIITKTRNPVGLATIVAQTGLKAEDITQVIEPFLLRNKMVLRTPRGRVIGQWKPT